jgi:uncharacterized protein YndB with AHSA1/START domain
VSCLPLPQPILIMKDAIHAILAPVRWFRRFWRWLSPMNRARLAFGVIGFVLGSLLMAALMGDSPEKRPVMMVVEGSSGPVHSAIPGRPVLAKAVLEPRPGRLLKYSWDFGDGSEPVEGIVTNPYAVSASHLYEGAEPGQKHTAKLTVTDVESGEQALGNYRVKFVEPTIDNKTEVALDDGLWALHASMKRSNDPVLGEIGTWNEKYHPLGSTAMCALAFGVNGFDARSERSETPYAETMERALNYVISRLVVVKLEGDLEKFDSNGNGIGLGVTGDKVCYEQPLITMALVASRDRDKVAQTGPEGVIGRKYEELVVDLLDFLAHAQVDPGNAQAGGWRYVANDSDADMSVTQWPVLAFMSAEAVWDIESPGFVREELKKYLKLVQNPNGGFGYQDGNSSLRVGLTGAGVIGHLFAGAKSSGDPVSRASDFIGKNWDSHNVGDYYAMYAVMKAAKLADPEIEKFGDHDWRAEYVEHLYQSQQPTGHWPVDSNYASGSLATAWPALILSKDIFAKGAPLALVWKILIGVGIAIPIAALGVLGYLLVRRRGAAAALGGDDGGDGSGPDGGDDSGDEPSDPGPDSEPGADSPEEEKPSAASSVTPIPDAEPGQATGKPQAPVPKGDGGSRSG